ncbi:MAG: hypothetical protein HY881_03780 [Deltaproteobacteria bacterium]|nr:hypothetical protein [Deltaproteobacteria bacterium]
MECDLRPFLEAIQVSFALPNDFGFPRVAIIFWQESEQKLEDLLLADIPKEAALDIQWGTVDVLRAAALTSVSFQ